MARRNPPSERYDVTEAIIKVVNEDAGPFSSPTLTRRSREIFAALATLEEATNDSYEAGALIAAYFESLIAPLDED